MARTLLGARAGQSGRARLHAAARIAPAQRPGAEALRAVEKAVCMAYTPSGASVPQGLTMLAMQRFGGAVHQGAVRLLPALALGRRAGGYVQPGEVSQQEAV